MKTFFVSLEYVVSRTINETETNYRVFELMIYNALIFFEENFALEGALSTEGNDYTIMKTAFEEGFANE